MKTKLFTLVFFTIISMSSFAQKNAKPNMVMKGLTLKIGGSLGGDLSIPGNSQNVPNAIDVLAYSEGISSACGTGANCLSINQQSLSITIYQTSNFPIIRQALLTHAKLNLELMVVNMPLDISTIYLEDAYINSISEGGSGGEDRYTLNISIDAKKWFFRFVPSDGSAITSHGWDFENNVVFTR